MTWSCLWKMLENSIKLLELINKFSRLLEYRWECKNQLYFYVLCYAKSLQLCPTLCDPIDGSPPGFPVPGILQARTLEWGAISFSNAWKWKGKVKLLSRVRFLATPWTAAHQAPPSMGFSKQEYWSGVPLPSPIQRAGLSKNGLMFNLDSLNVGKIVTTSPIPPPGSSSNGGPASELSVTRNQSLLLGSQSLHVLLLEVHRHFPLL